MRFSYDLGKDAWNVLRVITERPVNDPDNLLRPLGDLPRDFVAQVREVDDVATKTAAVKSFLEGEYQKEKTLIDEQVKSCTEQWAPINDAYFQALERIFATTISSDTAYAGYVTSAGSCPFNASNRWFMVRIGDTGADAIAAHEILHIEFGRRYGLYCRDELKLTPKEFTDFQEATTFLLNEEMGGLFSHLDYGYKEHQNLRAMLLVEWKKHKDFGKLLGYYVKVKDNR